jgi:hypothetical protein
MVRLFGSKKMDDRETECAYSAEPAPYQPPRLTLLGDIRDYTLGGSSGRGDSGSPTTQRTLRF